MIPLLFAKHRFSSNICNNLWPQTSGLSMPWSLQSLVGDDELELEPKSPEEKKAEREAKQKELDAKLAQGFGLPDPPPHKPAPKGGAAEALMWSGFAACELSFSTTHLNSPPHVRAHTVTSAPVVHFARLCPLPTSLSLRSVLANRLEGRGRAQQPAWEVSPPG